MSTHKHYLVQLDGLRFIAVTLVMIDHWLGQANHLPLGYFGVNLFFVLSGFLITRILINSKQRDTELGRGHGHSLKTFFIRRNLRIWPVYYLTIFVLALVKFQGVRLAFWWLITYTTNFWIVIHQNWLGAIDHLWSLAVEEQYYIFFPFLILFAPERHFLRILWTLIGLSFVLRVILFVTNAPWMIQFVMMPTCLDAFGLGGVLSWLIIYRRELFDKLFRSDWLLIGSFLLYVIHLFLMMQSDTPRNIYSDVTDRFVTSVFCAALIGRAVLGFGQPGKWLLENPVSRYMGQISYGLYLFHNLVFNWYHTQPNFITLRAWRRAVSIVPFLEATPIFQLMYFFTLTVALAALSWHFIEKPINSLKDRFSY